MSGTERVLRDHIEELASGCMWYGMERVCGYRVAIYREYDAMWAHTQEGER